jgi:putative oxidoreductase
MKKTIVIGRPQASLALKMQSVLRIVAAFLFFWHGTTKLFAFPAGMGPENLTAAVGTQAWFAGVLEVVGGGLLMLGLFTRPVAFILSGQMAVAYFQVHAPQGFWPTLNRGEAAALFCFTWLFFAAAGAGPWSLDAVLFKRRSHVQEHQDTPQFRAASNE